MPDKETICNSIYRIFLIIGTDVACFTSNRSMNFSFTCEWFLVFQVEPTFCQIGLKRSPEELSTSITVKQSDPVIGWTFAPLCKTSLLVSVSSSRQLDVRFGKNYCTDLLRTNFVLNVFFSVPSPPSSSPDSILEQDKHVYLNILYFFSFESLFSWFQFRKQIDNSFPLLVLQRLSDLIVVYYLI